MFGIIKSKHLFGATIFSTKESAMDLKKKLKVVGKIEELQIKYGNLIIKETGEILWRNVKK